MTLEYVIGIDGGGTKTLFKVANTKGEILLSHIGGPLNVNSTDVVDVSATIKQGINYITETLGIGIDDCISICLGCAGAGRDREKKLLSEIFTAIGYKNNLIITDDAMTLLYGAIGNSVGAVIIAGTGAICYGKKSDGEIVRCGGWGHIIDDEGSGYYIGVSILNSIMKSYDGRGPNTILTKMVFEFLNIASHDKIIEYVYKKAHNKNDIAKLAILLDRACEENDSVAHSIARESAHKLSIYALTVLNKIDDGSNIKLITNGSILNKGRYVSKYFHELIKQGNPNIKIEKTHIDAASGAIILALESNN